MNKILKRTLRVLWKVIRVIIIIILIPFVLYFSSRAYHEIRAGLVSNEIGWLKDLDSFEAGLLEKHVNSNWATFAHQQIEDKIDSLRQLVKDTNGDVDRDKMRVALMQISALLRDGHTHIANYKDEVGDFPLKAEWFKDGMYIVGADSSLSELLGYKITAVNETGIDEVLEKIHTICPSSNDSGRKLYDEVYILKPGFLYGLGLSDNPRTSVFQFENTNGETLYKELDGFTERTGRIYLEDISDYPEPLYNKHRDKAYWYEYDADRKFLYMNYRSVSNMGDDPMEQFVDRMMNLVDSVAIDKFIIDVRYNGGGDNFNTIKLVTEIQKRPKINKKGVLYAITSHDTFSAAISLVTHLSTKTNVTFAGEQIGDHNNAPGDAKYFHLHINDLTWQVSELFWENTFYGDLKQHIATDLPYLVSFTENLEGTNPIINKIIADTLNRVSSTWLVLDDSLKNYSGRYRFSPDKTLTLNMTDGILEISGFIRSGLNRLNDSTFKADNLRFTLTLREGQVVLTQNDSTMRVLPQLNPGEYTALELIEEGKYEDARRAYLVLYAEYGDSLHSIAANSLSTMAAYLYHSTGDNVMQMELLYIALEMHPKTMMPLGRMSGAKSIAGETMSSIGYGLGAAWYFDWKNIVNYGKTFGFI